jgi:hypothetical protein
MVPGRLSGTVTPGAITMKHPSSIAMHPKAKVRVCLACAAPMLWGVVHTCYEEAPILMGSGQLVALPLQSHQPETHLEFEFSHIQASLTAVSGVSGSVVPGRIVTTQEQPRRFGPVLHPGVT